MQREYGYIGPEEQESQPIVMRKGQNVAGYSVGILYLDNVWYPLVPGNVVNACTYDFPVRMKAVPGLDTPKLHSGDPAIFGTLLEAAKALEQEGVRAISAACGFFGHFHTQLAEAMDLPVALSSLVQVPWILTTLKRTQKIGVLTANASVIQPSKHCGVGGEQPLHGGADPGAGAILPVGAGGRAGGGGEGLRL